MAAPERTAPAVDLETLVQEADIGGRKPTGSVARGLAGVAVAWSLFQLWYASPLPFLVGFGIFNDTEARSIHLAFALFLAFTAYPALKSSPRNRVPAADWLLALLGAAAALYPFIFYRDLAQRPGLPIGLDIAAAVVGVLLLLEAARRAVGPALAVIAALMIAYAFAGESLPGLLAHRSASLGRAASQYWLTSEGVFGVALGVSTSFVFLFVLFGTLLEKAGAGNYFIQVAFALLGRYRGGPAKAGVVSSGLTGMISGSSIANVVTTGTFTIPLMKRVGYSPVKAGAIESAAGVNGQIMPPVMGAAAFLIAEYVGISYSEVVKHAFLPAILTYGSLFYIVDIEAMKLGLRGLPTSRRHTLGIAALRAVIGICGFIILAGAVYWGIGWTKTLLGPAAGWVLGLALVVVYVALIAQKARHPDLAEDDPTAVLSSIPDFGETARTGLHYLLPVIVLVWCLMVEEMSPGLSAFWGTLALIALVLTQRPLTALFRGEGDFGAQFARGWAEFVDALAAGARNMTGVGIATAAAGIIVGTVTLTGIGLVMTEIVEFVSGGNLILMLLLTAAICLVLGMGMPTTASYVVVATLMAPVLVELAAQNDLALPLISVHMFVFYFGLMADVTPPVGLAAYAAAAIAGADPVKTGIQAFRYEIRTGLLPFIFIFNPAILMIDIGGPIHFTVVIASAILAMMAFVAATQGFFLTRNRWWETVALLLVCFTLFRPGFWMDLVAPPLQTLPGSSVTTVIGNLPGSSPLNLRIGSEDINGDPETKAVRLTLGQEGDTRARLAASGLTLATLGDEVTVASVRPGSEAARLKLRPGDRVEGVNVPTERPSPYLFAIPAVLAMVGIAFLQRRRRGVPVMSGPKVAVSA